VSTIKVDTYLTRGGVSEIAIDKLKGASSASSISVVAEGGSTTTNLQQGLAKVWMNMAAGQTTNGSFNTSALTDNGTGDYTITIANDMANDDYAAHHTASDANTNESVLIGVTKGGSFATGSFGVYVLNDDSGVSDGSDPSSISVFGDLA
jgi:hypothetical protein